MYEALIGEPHREWTITALSQRLPKIGVAAVQNVVVLLLDDGVVLRVNHPGGLWFRMAGDGALILSELLFEWNQDFSVAAGTGRPKIKEVQR